MKTFEWYKTKKSRSKLNFTSKARSISGFEHKKNVIERYEWRFIYKSYRNTKTQVLCGDNRYNKRKLNELLRVISMLSNSELKLELLREHVYLN